MKLITFAVPCYNSAEYMDKCINTLLQGGDDIEIILVDDGSVKDNTPEICDRYEKEYPGIIRAIHQENGGHGEGVNQGMRNAQGLYYKVVDSDDWLDVDALHKALDQLRKFVAEGTELDMLICNYVYEHVCDNTRHVMNYKNVFPTGEIFSWDDINHFQVSQCLLMHSVIYRTQLLRDCKLELPKHTFYVDNIFVYQPLPYVKSIYYMDLDLYRYYIGRDDQSVNESVMASRIDQQLRVTKIMIDSYNLNDVKKVSVKLYKYMLKYITMMMTISNIFAVICDDPDKDQKREDLWTYLRLKDENIYNHIKHGTIFALANFQSKFGQQTGVFFYRIARKIYKFN